MFGCSKSEISGAQNHLITPSRHCQSSWLSKVVVTLRQKERDREREREREREGEREGGREEERE